MDYGIKARWSFPYVNLEMDSAIPDFDRDFIRLTDLNWNIEALDLPGLENHRIYYFMHAIFIDSGTFCVADIPYLKPEDLQWQITVQYEHFDKCNSEMNAVLYLKMERITEVFRNSPSR